MLENINRSKIQTYILILILSIASLNFFYQLGFEYSQPTADLWINRAYRFFLAFKNNDFAGTYVFYHPGVTITWLVGAIVWYFPKYQQLKYGVIYDPMDERVFSEFNSLALIPIVTVAFGTILFLSYTLFKNVGIKVSLLFLFFFATENFFIGNIRSIHMDAFVSLFLFGSFLTYSYFLYNFDLKSKIFYFTTSALFLALSILTRSNSLIYMPFFGIINLLYLILIKQLNFKAILKQGVLMILFIFIGYVFMIITWPAMWVDPVGPVIRMLNEGVFTTGLQDVTKSQLIYLGGFENESIVTKLIHYPLIFLFRTNGGFILLLFLSISALIAKVASNKRKLYLYLTRPNDVKVFLCISSIIFILFYLFVISIPDKMIFRYVLPIYPFAFLLTAIFIYYATSSKPKPFKSTLIFCLIVILVESFSTFPNSLTYYNRFIGGIDASSKIINTDQAGAGLPVVARDLNKIDQDASVSVYDSVPFSQYFYGSTKALKFFDKENNLVNTDYVIIGKQNFADYFDISRTDYKLLKTYSFGLMDQWYLYKKLN